MKLGKLYGVGVGPGATDLMTLRSVSVLKSVSVIAIPQASKYATPFCWRIAEPVVGEVPNQERLFLDFPMSKDPSILRPAWDNAFKEIGKRLNDGLSVAFITQGDPLVYSTFIYLLNESTEHWPGIEVEVIPGITSLTAVPSAIATPVADGMQRIAVLPATYGVESLKKILNDFDTVLLMKVSSVIPQVVDILEDLNLLENAVYVSKATSSNQKIVRDLRSIRNNKCDYFSMILVSKGTRGGVLVDGRTKSTSVQKGCHH